MLPIESYVWRKDAFSIKMNEHLINFQNLSSKFSLLVRKDILHKSIKNNLNIILLESVSKESRTPNKHILKASDIKQLEKFRYFRQRSE